MEPTEVNKLKEGGVSLPLAEPFPCPACGQMLAPSCRVCVVCKKPVDFAQVMKAEAEKPIVATAPPSPGRIGPARFSWSIFFTSVLLYLAAAIVMTNLLGEHTGKYVMGALVLLSSMWVYFDAQKKGIPKPLRWVLGALLLWIVVFPWYLSRRRTPQAPCPFIEGEASPAVRVVFLILMVFFFVGALLMIIQGPPPK